MLNEKVLTDSWVASGRTYEEFKELLTELSDCTQFVSVEPTEISVLSLISVNEEKARFYELHPCNTGAPQKTPEIKSLSISKVLAKGSHEQLLRETFDNVKALFFADGNVFFPAERIMTRGLVQFGAGGPAMGIPSYERDLYISSLFKMARTSTFVTREVAGVKKLVAILSAKYQALPQSALCEIIDALNEVNDFGKMNTYLWMMTNWTSDIYVEFPEKAEEIRSYYELSHDFIPGLWLRTSDTGDSSVKIYPTWRHKNSISYVEQSAVKRVHTGRVELSHIITEVIEKAFAEYARMPEALCNLMSQTLTDESLDLTTEKGASKNKKTMESIVKKAFRDLEIVKAVGKKARKALQEQLCAELSGNICYTAYDLAVTLMSLPERLEGVNAETRHHLESAVSKAPYIKYVVDDETEEEDLILI